MSIEGKAPTQDPNLKQVPVVTGWFTLLEKKDVEEGPPEWDRTDGKTKPPDDVEETEQKKNHTDGKSG
jgi:hypothetical protein